MAAQLYDISVSAGNDLVLSIPLVDETVPNSGFWVEWFVFATDFGVPILSPILVGKSSEQDTISWGSPGTTLNITLSAGDTTDMLGNYYHEAMLMDDASGNRTTIVQGTFTVTQSVLG